jgi:hypothetical protein
MSGYSAGLITERNKESDVVVEAIRAVRGVAAVVF